MYKTNNNDVILSLMNRDYTLTDALNNKLAIDMSTESKYFIDIEKRNIVKINNSCESLYGALTTIEEINTIEQINNL